MKGCFLFTVLCLLLLQFSESLDEPGPSHIDKENQVDGGNLKNIKADVLPVGEKSISVSVGEKLGGKDNETIELKDSEKQVNTQLTIDKKAEIGQAAIEKDSPLKKAVEQITDTKQLAEIIRHKSQNQSPTVTVPVADNSKEILEQAEIVKEKADDTVVQKCQVHMENAKAKAKNTTEKIEEKETTSLNIETTVGQKVENQTTTATTKLAETLASNSIDLHGTRSRYFNIFLTAIFVKSVINFLGK